MSFGKFVFVLLCLDEQFRELIFEASSSSKFWLSKSNELFPEYSLNFNSSKFKWERLEEMSLLLFGEDNLDETIKIYV